MIASLEGRLYAFDAFTGELRWRDEEATAQTPPPWDEEIVATGSTVVRHRHRDSPAPGFAGTDVRTGEPTWRYASEHPECATRADATGDTVIISYVCESSNELVGLDGATGELIWSTPLSDSAFVAGGVITLIDEDGGLLDPRSGRELGADPGLPLASDSGEIITSAGSLFEAGDTAPRWEVPDASPTEHDFSAAIGATFLGDVVVLVNDRSCPGHGGGLELRVVDRADGRVRRSFECADLPAEYSLTSTEVISAPGAVIVKGRQELVAVG